MQNAIQAATDSFTCGNKLAITEKRLSDPFFAIHVRSLLDVSVTARAKATQNSSAVAI